MSREAFDMSQLPEDALTSYVPRATDPDSTDSDAMTASLLASVWTLAPATAMPAGSALPSDVPPGAVPHQGPAAPVYELECVIGRGGMGTVWRAEQRSLSRPVAIKRITPPPGSLKATPIQQDLFRQEALVAARLEHPNIVPVHDFGLDENGDALMAMKLVTGKPWHKVLEDDFETMPVPEFLARHLPILGDVAQAVAFAHNHGIVHRDLKPSQVMVGDFGETQLMDWGLALIAPDNASEQEAGRIANLHLSGRDSATNPGGTPALMAPEQTVSGAQGIGPWTDVYLLGGTLYYLLTGTYPHQAASAAKAFAKAARGEIVPPEIRCPERHHPPELVELCLQALSYEREKRVSSAREFARRLEDYFSGASKRRESQHLCVTARERLEEANGSYTSLSLALADLGRARGLWDDNPEIPPLLQRALSNYTQAALENGDLVLARLYAERIASSPAADKLLSRVTAAEKHAISQARQRRLAVRTSIGALAAILLGGTIFSLLLFQANRSLADQRDLLVHARGESESLIQYMISDLRARIAPLDPELTALQDLAARATEHYAGLDISLLATDELEQVHDGMLDLALVLLTQSALDDALSVAEQSLELARQEENNQPDDPTWRGREARSLLILSRIHLAKGAVDACWSNLKASLEIYEALSKQEPANLTWTEGLYRTWRLAAQVSLDHGDDWTGITQIHNAVEQVEKLVDASPEDQELQREYATTLSLEGSLHVSLDQEEDARSAYDDANAVLQGLAETHPESPEIWGALGDNSSQRSWFEWDVAGPRVAMDFAEDAADQYTHALNLDPSNLPIRAELVGVYSKLCRMHTRVDELEEAVASGETALQLAEELLQRSHDNASFNERYAETLTSLSLALEENGDWDRAEDLREKRIEVAKFLLDQDRSVTDWEELLDHAYIELAQHFYDREITDRVDEFDAHRARIAEWKRRAELWPDDPRSRSRLSDACQRLGFLLLDWGEIDEGTRYLDESVSAWDGFQGQLSPYDQVRTGPIRARRMCAWTWEKVGRRDKSDPLWDQLDVDLQRHLEEDGENSAWWIAEYDVHDDRSELAFERGEDETAFDHGNRALAAAAKLVELTNSVQWKALLAGEQRQLAKRYRLAGRMEEALEHLEESYVTYDKLIEENPEFTDFRRGLVESYTEELLVRMGQGDFDRVQELMVLSREVQSTIQVAPGEEELAAYNTDRLTALIQGGVVLVNQGNLEGAGKIFDDLVQEIRPHAIGARRAASATTYLKVAAMRAGGVHLLMGQTERADETLGLLDSLLNDYGDDDLALYESLILAVYVRRTIAKWQLSRLELDQVVRRGKEIEQLLEESSFAAAGDPVLERPLAEIAVDRAHALLLQGRLDETGSLIREATDRIDAVLERFPESANLIRPRAQLLALDAQRLIRQGETDEAIAVARRALDDRHGMESLPGASTLWRSDLAEIGTVLAEALLVSGDLQEALKEASKAAELARTNLEEYPFLEPAETALAGALELTGRIQSQLGDSEAATATWKEALASLPPLDTDRLSLRDPLRLRLLRHLGKDGEADTLAERLQDRAISVEE
ncbi:protein kinase [bacterium]|nr:protein kinase [bacterium]